MSGAVQVGFRPLIGLDQSPLSRALLRLNDVPIVLHGDLQHLRTLARFHLAHLTSRSGLLAGFPCQPFSTLGRSLAFRDPRSKTFLCISGLGLAYPSFFPSLGMCGWERARIHKSWLLWMSFCLARGFQRFWHCLAFEQCSSLSANKMVVLVVPCLAPCT